MDPARFFAASRVLIVAGKGGVGKSTMAAALSRSAARAGLSTLLVRLTPGGPISRLFAQPELSGTDQTLHAGGGPGAHPTGLGADAQGAYACQNASTSRSAFAS